MARGPGKGKTNNPNGRPQGSVNKDVAPLREKFQQLLDGYSIEKMLDDLDSLEPQERLRVVTGLAEYLVPKLARTEVKQEGDNTLVIKVVRTNSDSRT
jgi:hypothetical protein